MSGRTRTRSFPRNDAHSEHRTDRRDGSQAAPSGLIMRRVMLLMAVATFSVPSTQIPLSTWSIVAADPSTGDVGVAGASCVAMYADGIAALVPGKGAGVAQALLDLENRNMVFDRLVAGDRADEIVSKVTDPKDDNGVQDRQYGVVTISNRQVQLKTFTGKEAMTWAGSAEDAVNAVTVQGNILAGPAV